MSELPFRDLARLQLDFDRKATRRIPGTFEFKRSRMLSSPHAFLRGSAPLFYELLRQRPDLRAPLPGRGWIDGDMHLENFGAFRTEAGEVTFDLNDFDEALPGAPWSDDLLRLCASCFLSGGFTGHAGSQLLSLVGELLEAHARAAFSAKPPRPPPLPRPLAFLLARAETRTKRQMLDSRAPLRKDKKRRRQFTLGGRYLPLAGPARRALPRLLAGYAETLGEHCPAHLQRFEVEDVAQRIAGTGSLGVTRYAALIRSSDKVFLYDLKEGRPAASARAAAAAAGTIHNAGGFPSEAERVVAGARALLADPPRRLRALWSKPLRLSFIARQFSPSEDKLDLNQLGPGELSGIASTLGHLLGRAHRRAAQEIPRRAWRDAERRDLMRRAAALTAVIEGAYLAYAFEDQHAGH